MLQSCLTKHLLKADILFRGEFEIIPVDSGICRCRASDPLFCGCHQSGSLSGVTRERHPASQSEHLCMPKNFSAYKGTARSPQVRRKIRGGKIFEKSMPNLRYGFRGWVVSLCNITTMRAPKQTLGTDWSGHRNRGISPSCILQHERSIFLLRSLSRYKLHEIENGILNGLTQ